MMLNTMATRVAQKKALAAVSIVRERISKYIHIASIAPRAEEIAIQTFSTDASFLVDVLLINRNARRKGPLSGHY
jgi:DNA-binding protein